MLTHRPFFIHCVIGVLSNDTKNVATERSETIGMYTLGQAEKATGRRKSTIHNAIKKGRISAQKDDLGKWRIDPAELHRVYPPVSSNDTKGIANERGETHNETGVLEAKFEALKEERERERQQLEKTIEDLRQRLDDESGERRRLTRLLTNEREHKPAPPKTRLWGRLFGNAS